MSKTKKTNIARYEILYIVSNEFSEDEVVEMDKKVQKIVEDNKAKILKKESLGKKRLAYKIKKFDYGYYNFIIFETERENVIKIDRLVRQMREILRYCIVVNNEDYESPKPKDEKEVKEAIEEEKSKDTEVKDTKIKDAKVDKDKSIIDEEKKDIKIKDAKVEDSEVDEDKDNLDKKLDDILEAKNLF